MGGAAIGAAELTFDNVFVADADLIADRLRRRLERRLGDRLAPPPPAPRMRIPLAVNRSPYFCSGCPHNSSTKVPDGALIGGGIGCHSMVMFMEPERVGHIVGLTAMGNEGAQWFGMAPFVDEHHLIQNIGDGTLFHSGLLAIRAAIANAANGVNITYKILYNGAVSMTGGQEPVTQLDVPSLVKVLLAEGVSQVLITTDDRSRYAAIELPAGVKVWGRDRVIEAQELLATVPGCTVLIHDQRCAAELRRDRKRGRIASPNFRVVINDRVCEGCGDCSVQSNCLSVETIDTEFGRKRRINQSTCNKDTSCLKGFCPSFVTVRGGTLKKATAARAVSLPQSALPEPAPVALDRPWSIVVAGVGGTGVITIGQLLGMAAHVEGKGIVTQDSAGLAQKGGAVFSHVKLARSPEMKTLSNATMLFVFALN